MKCKVIKAPKSYDGFPESPRFKLFLAGSIEMGNAINWQECIIKGLANMRIVIFNPRRDNWDSSWGQDIRDDRFREQVCWELDKLNRADLIIMYFDINTKSPITLLELGLYANSKRLVVCCPEGFWKKGNVDIVCRTYGIPMVSDLEELIAYIRIKVGE
jgi:hypothetical protein